MQFIKLADSSAGERDLASSLNEALNSGPVLWLVSGGSNIEIEVRVLRAIDERLSERLSILLTDERLGPQGHQDSNYRQLLDSGLDLKRATFPDILEGYDGPEATLGRFIQTYEALSMDVAYVIAELGIGTDGHIAGILPSSPGVNSASVAVYYDSPPYTRLTLSLKSLAKVDQAFVFCFGESKRSALAELKESQEDLNSRPSLILRELKNVKVYNDQL